MTSVANGSQIQLDEVAFLQSTEDPLFWLGDLPPIKNTPNIKHVNFSILSTLDLETQSVADVTTTSTPYEQGLPRSGGLLDLRGGTADRSLLCQTCGNDSRRCIGGHWMTFPLPRPVVNPCFTALVVRVLNSICFGCLNLRRKDESLATLVRAEGAAFWTNEIRMRLMVKHLTTCRRCKHCQCPCPKISINMLIVRWAWTPRNLRDLAVMARDMPDNPHSFTPPNIDLPDLEPAPSEAVVKGSSKGLSIDRKPMDIDFIITTLRSISPKVYAKLGIDCAKSHPADCIMTTLPIPPVSTRPTVLFSSSRKHMRVSDRTSGLKNILSSANKLRKFRDDAQRKKNPVPDSDTKDSKQPMGIRRATREVRERRSNRTPEQKEAVLYSDMCFDLQMFMDSDSSTATQMRKARGRRGGHGSGNIAKKDSIMPSIRGRDGGPRDSQMGKRVNGSARNVACPTQSLGMRQMSIPAWTAQTLNDEIRVQRYNMRVCRERIVLGATHPDGCKIVIRGERSTGLKMLDQGQREEFARRLAFNDVLIIPLPEGHPLIHNRQPSLHRGSIMRHYIHRAKDEYVVRINPSAASASNLDYDGDSSNIYAPGGLVARAEMELLSVENRLCTSNFNLLMGLIQDSLVAADRLTKPGGVRIDEWLFQFAICAAKNLSDADIDRALEFRSEDGTYSGEDLISILMPASFSYNRNGVQIHQGRLLPGGTRLGKPFLGRSCTSIIAMLATHHGTSRAIDFIDDAQRVWSAWMSQSALTITLEEMLLTDETQRRVRAVVDQVEKRVDIAANNGASEAFLIQLLQTAMDRSAKIALHLVHPDSGLVTDVRSGAKGSEVNRAQIMTLVSQQMIEQRRYGNKTERSLPSYPLNQKIQGCASRGFVKSSFANGMTMEEFVAHATGGRGSMIYTCCGTSWCGYLHRKLMIELCNLIVQYDGSVRVNGMVVQWGYGTDGMIGNKMVEVLLDDVPEWSKSVIQPAGTRTVYLPFDAVDCALQVVVPDYIEDDCPEAILVEVCREAQKLVEMIETIVKRRFGNRIQTLSVVAHIHDSADKVAETLRTVKSVKPLYAALADRYFRSMVEAGEAVGSLAADSEGALITQLVLNVFHHAGMLSVTATQGVPRLQELINGTPEILTPRMFLWGDDLEHIANHIPRRVMDDIVLEADIIFQPNMFMMPSAESTSNCSREVIGCTNMMRSSLAHVYGDGQAGHSPWVLEMQLNGDLLARMNMNTFALSHKIREFIGASPKSARRYYLEISSPSSKAIFLRLRITNCADIADNCRSDLKRRFPMWTEERLRRSVSAMFKSMTHSLQRKLLSNMRIGGINSVSFAEVCSPSDRLGTSPAEKRVVTVGSSLRESWSIPGVDWQRTISNDVRETVNTLGIEAGMMILLSEMREVMCSGGDPISDSHLLLTVSSMMRSGVYTPLTRFVQGYKQRPPLVRAAFEQQVAAVVNGAIFSEESPVQSFSDSLMTGNITPGGTGIVHLINDPKYVAFAQKKLKAEEDIRTQARSQGGGKLAIRALLHSDRTERRKFSNNKVAHAARRMPPSEEYDLGWMKEGGLAGRRISGNHKKHDNPDIVQANDHLDFEAARAYLLGFGAPMDEKNFIDPVDEALPRDGTAPLRIMCPEVSRRIRQFRPAQPVFSNAPNSKITESNLKGLLAAMSQAMVPTVEQGTLYSADGRLQLDAFQQLVNRLL